ncbi:SH3 domain-containing protein [Marinobacter hydrocarbonoclasticus]|nr:SH3 domain-containing protein [Marinobacter nauticus]
MTKFASIAVVVPLTLAGCQMTEQDQQTFSALGGAVLGGVVGSQVGGGSGKAIATVAGVALGAWLGSTLYKNLSQNDQEDLSAETVRVLETAGDGSEEVWRGEDSNTEVTITPTETKTAQRETAMVKLEKVAVPPTLEIINKPYRVTANTNIRQGPGTDYDIMGTLKSGASFNVVGQVQNRSWLLVEKNGVSVGYIYGPLAEPLTEASNSPVQAHAEATKQLRPPLDLDQIQLEQKEVTELDDITLNEPQNVVADDVTVQTTCRTLQYSDENSQQKEQFQACKASDGAWEIL